MSRNFGDIGRRGVLKRGTALGAAALGGAGGLAFLTDSARAADTSLEATDPKAVETDDGEIKYVAFGGRLRFEWDGLDTEATHGWFKTETRINTGSGWSGWRNHGTGSGELGDGSGEYEQGETGGWGGNNDSNSGPGTDGFFQFKYGDDYNNQDYAIAGSGSNLNDHANKWDTSNFEADTDGGTQQTKVQFRKTCRVYDGEVGGGGSMLIEASDKAMFTVTVNNEEATATTGGEINGEVGADAS